MLFKRDLAAMPDGTDTSGARDFEFLMGNWKVQNRRLKNPLKGSTAWYEFAATAVARPLWGGLGLTLRLFDPKARQWSLFWANRANWVMEFSRASGSPR